MNKMKARMVLGQAIHNIVERNFDVRFYNVRSLEEVGGENGKPRIIVIVPRITVMVARNTEGKGMRSISICHWNDTPCRTIGNAVAAVRMAGLFKKTTKQNWISATVHEMMCDALLHSDIPGNTKDEGMDLGLRSFLYRYIFGDPVIGEPEEKEKEKEKEGLRKVTLGGFVEELHPFEEDLFKPREVKRTHMHVVCENEDCEDAASLLNEFTIQTKNVEATMEAWGHGAEGKEDYCETCGELGVLYEGEVKPLSPEHQEKMAEASKRIFGDTAEG